jgi:hypothetical protein
MGPLTNTLERWRTLLGNRSVTLRDGLRLGKGIMLVVLLGLAAVFIYDMIAGPETPVASLGHEADPAGSARGLEPAGKPLAYYSGVVAGRHLFGAGSGVVSNGGQALTVSQDTSGKLYGLALQGVILDETPQAVIEDEGVGKTLFLHEGDVIRGMVVEKILKGKVILKHGDEHLELTL